jgi:hypothetical protein
MLVKAFEDSYQFVFKVNEAKHSEHWLEDHVRMKPAMVQGGYFSVGGKGTLIHPFPGESTLLNSLWFSYSFSDLPVSRENTIAMFLKCNSWDKYVKFSYDDAEMIIQLIG